jgi:hypothetical protein
MAVGAAASSPAQTGPPRLLGLRISNGGTPFAGDTPWLTTVSPNGDGFRDRALIRFKLDGPGTVEVRVVATFTSSKLARTIWSTRQSLAAGAHTIVWRPARTTPDRTYLVRFVVTGPTGGRRVYGFEPPRRGQLTSGLVVHVQGVEAGFLDRSYPVGSAATVAISTDAPRVRLQLFSFASVPNPTVHDLRTGGVAVAPPVRLDWHRRGSAVHYVQISQAGVTTTGLYFLRVTASDGRVGYAPLIVRPRRLGTHRVAVVLSTNTWQAYNFFDANGDGWGDSWNVGGTGALDLRRPYLDFGVPVRFRDWDLSFISWLNRTGKAVDYLSDDDLAAVRRGEALRRAYDLVVFPGHEEYVSGHAYDVLRRYRNLGGRLMFLSANNLFWKVTMQGPVLRRAGMWRKLGRPEASLVGVQWAASSGSAQPRAPYVVQGASAALWAFAGTGLRNGSSFGRYGLELDSRAPSSPPGTRVLARIPHLVGHHDAEMTYYETPAGARVFAAGVVDFAASITDPAVSRLVDNVWARLTR